MTAGLLCGCTWGSGIYLGTGSTWEAGAIRTFTGWHVAPFLESTHICFPRQPLLDPTDCLCYLGSGPRCSPQLSFQLSFQPQAHPWMSPVLYPPTQAGVLLPSPQGLSSVQ